MIMAESTVLENIETGKVERQCRYFKAKFLGNHEAKETDKTLKQAIEDEQIIVFFNKVIYIEVFTNVILLFFK